MITIWHNPRCSKSRQTLALLEGRDVTIRLYLDDAPDAGEISAALALLNLRAIDLIRRKEPEFRDLGLGTSSDDATLIAAMAATPKLIERPVVFANGKAAIGRPPDSVLDIL